MMKKTRILSVCMLLLVSILMSHSAKAQIDLGSFITTGKEDATKLIEGYASPMLRAVGNNFNSGWYNTAEVLKPGRFEIRVVPSASIIPDFDRYFDVKSLELSAVEFVGVDKLPTMFGDQGVYDVILRAQGDNTSIELENKVTIPTVGMNLWPGISPQLSIGVFKNTELMVRYLPPLSSSPIEEIDYDMETSYLGFGLKHDLLPWFVENPKFNWTVAGAWFKTKIAVLGPFFNEEDLNEIYGDDVQSIALDVSSQSAELSTTGYRFDMLISREFGILTLYGGLGYSNSDTRFHVEGEYPFVNYDGENNQWVASKIVDPTSIEVSTSHVELSGGVRFRLAILSLSFGGAYSPTGYSTIHMGVGLGYLN